MCSDSKAKRKKFVEEMIEKLRAALLDGNEFVSISSSAGSVTHNRKEMEERLAEYEAELSQLENGPNIGPVIKTADMRRTW
ncbi:MAG: hypothetical protein FWD31_02520 [Planctomycetaceae bacterium]|nr:hypothetical protein [Planctomycetaceae bacterium]